MCIRDSFRGCRWLRCPSCCGRRNRISKDRCCVCGVWYVRIMRGIWIASVRLGCRFYLFPCVCIFPIVLECLVFGLYKSINIVFDLFKEWFHNNFAPSIEKHLASKKVPRKATLIIHNGPTSELESGDIVVKLLPGNITSLIQPMDQGVLESFKCH